MTMARNDEFNRDMDNYLRGRRVTKRTNPLLAARNYFSTLFSVKQQKKEEMPLDIPQEQVQAVLAQSAAPQKTTPRQTQYTPAQKPKVNTMGWFSKKKEEDYEMVETAPAAQPAMDEEVKEVLKITFKWLKMMDPETIDEIKRSPDFEKYKRVLDKYGLIKK
jgi:hypothetical protein